MVLVFVLFVYLEKNNKENAFVLNKTKQLSSESLHVLNQIDKNKTVVFEVYANPDSALANKINNFFKAYLRNNKNLEVQFLDPSTHPNEVKLNSVSMQGEIVMRIKDSNLIDKINVTELSESSIINGILSLLNKKDEWLVIAEGYGMNTIEDESDQGLSKLLIHLKKLGFKVARMPLDSAVVLPDNVKAIVLTAPTKELGVDIVEWLKQQTNKGIGIWWLNDVGVKSQFNLELVFDVLYSDMIQLNDQESTAYVSNFIKHPITENFNQPVYIPQTREIIAEQFIPFIANHDNRSYAVTKQLENSRLVFTGDSDFIRNQYINSAANKSMTVRIVDWLMNNDKRVNIPVKINNNTQLLLSQAQLLGMSVFFLIMVPFIFLIIVFIQWRKIHAK